MHFHRFFDLWSWVLVEVLFYGNHLMCPGFILTLATLASTNGAWYVQLERSKASCIVGARTMDLIGHFSNLRDSPARTLHKIMFGKWPLLASAYCTIQ
jgi:hypothetical protein